MILVISIKINEYLVFIKIFNRYKRIHTIRKCVQKNYCSDLSGYLPISKEQKGNP
ncbi:MAG: hypothetical protein IEMM0008_0146 [bacterium]|nr:MAG: hypothetical protein IEMM0008_0146 [bacterium]